MKAVAKMRQAGFALAISERGGLLIDPASWLTAEQRAFIKANKVVLLSELRQEQEPAAQVTIQPQSEVVCCGDCRHSVLPPQTEPRYGWRSCGLGVEGGGGFGRADRRCSQFDPGEIQAPEIDPLASRIAELVADGWSIWNAQARAESETFTMS